MQNEIDQLKTSDDPSGLVDNLVRLDNDKLG